MESSGLMVFRIRRNSSSLRRRWKCIPVDARVVSIPARSDVNSDIRLSCSLRARWIALPADRLQCRRSLCSHSARPNEPDNRDREKQTGERRQDHVPKPICQVSIPSSSIFSRLHHLLDEPPEGRNGQETQRRCNQTHCWTVGHEIENRSNDRQTGSCRHDSPRKIVPKPVQNIDRGKPASGLQSRYEIGCSRYCEKEHRGKDGRQWRIPVSRIKNGPDDKVRGDDNRQAADDEAVNKS